MEIPVYISHIRDLLNQSSSDSYERKLKEFESSWSQSVHQYYMIMIHSEVSKVNAMQYIFCMCCTM